MIVSSYHHLAGPLVTLGALGVILLLCRWAFSTPQRPTGRAGARGDYGLLVPVATVATAHDAELLRTLLREAGIRCTVAGDPDGVDVLVFRADALRARELVSS